MTESTTDYDVTAVDPPASERRRKKKSGAFGIFKALLHLMRKRKTHAAKFDLAKPDPNWTKLVGSIRPLRLQESAEIISPAAAEIGEIIPTKTGEIISPAISSTSHYSSASSLLDLDNSSDEEEDDPDEVFDALAGDELIDAKADEFIAQFYKQLQLQKTAKHHHHAR